MEDAIPYIKMYFDESDFSDHDDPFLQAAIAERKAQKEAQKIGKKVADRVERYIMTASKMSSQSAKRPIVVLLNLAKWIYRDETRKNFADIPIINRLYDLKHSYAKAERNEGPSVPYAHKSADWSDTPKVVKWLKNIADTHKTPSGKIKSKRAIATDIQRLLVYSLLVAIPPRRNRVITELELDRTLQRGKVDPRSGFIPEIYLSPGEKVKWCINLGPNDHKMGGVYGGQAFEINDMPYDDGTSLYDYLNKWVEEYRPVFEPDHKILFVAIKKHKELKAGRPITGQSIKSIVQRGTRDALGKPIAPKEFRKMFVSFISNRPDMSEADLEAIAKGMGHSRKMQMSVYDQVTAEARLATAMDVSKRLWQEINQPEDHTV